MEGFVSLGNSTGICDTVAAKTSYNRVFIADCIGYDLFFLDEGRYKLSNAIVLSSAQNPFVVTGREGKRCELEVDNVLFRRVGPTKPALITSTAVLNGRRLTLENIEFDARGSLEVAGQAELEAILTAMGDEMRREVLARLKQGRSAP